MAETEPTSTPPAQTPPPDDGFHYYSGGEIKENAESRVPAWLSIGGTLLALGGLAFFIFGGGLGPRNPYQPVGGSSSTITAVQQGLYSRDTAPYMQSVNVLDMSRLPLPPGQSLTQAIDAGSTVYQTYCIGCHGPNQDGNGVNAAALNPKPRNLRDVPFMEAMSYQRIMTSLHRGVPGTAMPRWENTLSEAQIQDVSTYVYSLTTPLPTSSTSPSAAPSGASPAGTGAEAGSGAPAAPSAAKLDGTSQFHGNSVHVSPKPITPAIDGNPAAHTSTAPPSASGQPSGSGGTVSPVKPASPAPPGNSSVPGSGGM